MKWEREKPRCITSEQAQELTHFGTPGMKWGVRREIGKLAREHAILSDEQKVNTKWLRRTNNRIAIRNEKGKSTLKLEQRKLRIERANQAIAKTMKKNYSDLSPADIAQGKRSLMNKAILGGFLAGIAGSMIAVTVPSIRAHRKLNEN